MTAKRRKHGGGYELVWFLVNAEDISLLRVGGVDVFNWNVPRPDESGRHRLLNNFGDLIGPTLVERLVGAEASVRPTVGDDRVLLTVGSVLHFAPENAVIWGSGINFKIHRPIPSTVNSLDFRAVRGPLTARTLAAVGVSVPAVYGDPALLLPRYLPELSTWSRLRGVDVLVVPNFNDYQRSLTAARALGLTVIDPRAPLSHVLQAIASAQFVIGSSLHAIIVADSLDIPARLVASQSEHPFKYVDYLAGTGRPYTEIAPDFESALAMGGHEPLDVDLDALAAVFPFDLWGRAKQSETSRNFSERPSVLAEWASTIEQRPLSSDGLFLKFTNELLPGLVESAESLLDHLRQVGDEESPASSAFSREYEDVLGLRRALGSLLPSNSLDDRLAQALDALDLGSESAFLRSIWLRREGPHALLRSERKTDTCIVLSITVRPGRLTNDVQSIAIRVHDTKGQALERSLPVFPMYQAQWSVDLTAAFDEETLKRPGGWRINVALVDGELGAQDLVVCDASSEEASLLSYSELGAASPAVLRMGGPSAGKNGDVE